MEDNRYMFESAMMHMQKVNRRLTILTGIAVVMIVTLFAGFLYFLTCFEFTTEKIDVSSQNGPVNYIGEDNNGDIINAPSDSK